MDFRFFVEIASRSLDYFLSAIGTTSLGFIASNILQFFVFELATWLVIWLKRGKQAMMTHKAENFLIGALAYLVSIVTIYAPIYVRQVIKTGHAIRYEASHQPLPPCVWLPPVPPDFATEVSSASISVSIVPTEFSFDLGGPYKLDHKRQFTVSLDNSSHAVDLVELNIKFPYPVEAEKITQVRGIRAMSFQPQRPLINLLGAQLENNGCLGRWSYDLRAERLQRFGHAEVSVILNGHSAANPDPQITIKTGNGHIAGDWVYHFRGKAIKNKYFAEVEPVEIEQTNLKVLETHSTIPPGFKEVRGFTVLEGPCIPNDSLIGK